MDLILEKKREYLKRGLLSVLFAVFCFLMPFEEVMVGSFGTVLKLIGIMLMAATLLCIKTLKISKGLIWLGVWIIFCAASYVWANSEYWWKYFFEIYFNQTLFVFVLSQIPYELIDFKFVKKGLAAGSLLAASLLIFFPTTSAYIEGRRTIVVGDANMNPNILAAVLLLGFYAILSLKPTGQKIMKNILFYSALGLVLGAVLYTGSRGALISIIGSFVIMLLLNMKKSNRLTRKKTVWIVVATVIILILILVFIPEDYLTARFSLDNLFGFNEYLLGVHNRYSIWLNSWKLFVQSPILGYGCGNFFDAIATVYRQCAAHNLIVLSMVEMGILGSIPLFLFLWDVFKKTYRTKNIVLIAMLCAIFIMSLTLDSLPYKYFWITTVICLIESKSINAKTEKVLAQ